MDNGVIVSEKKTPGAACAVGSFLLIIFTLIILVAMGVNIAVSLFAGALMAAVIAAAQGVSWPEMEAAIVRVAADCIPTLLIVIMVGMLIGLWMAGGVVPSLMYYGMKLISPKLLVPMAFLLCCLTSEFTGTSFGSIATMGLAMMSVAAAMDIPMALVAGAVVSGAFFGDKMSPVSDTTNLAAGMSRVPLYEHIGSMVYTTAPAALIALLLFALAGLRYGGGAIDAAKATLICDTLEAYFRISPLLLLPAILVLLVSAFRLPALVGMALAVVLSALFAMAFQGLPLAELMNYAFHGFSIHTGVEAVDPMLDRGGVTAMSELLVIFILAGTMGALISVSGILNAAATGSLLKIIKGRAMLIGVALAFCYAVNFLTAGGQTVAIIITQQTFAPAFERMGLHPKMLSRVLEDAGTLSAPLVPWGISAVFISGVLGCGTEYIKYCWFIFLIPLCSMFCAVSGYGCWDREGRRLWGGG